MEKTKRHIMAIGAHIGDMELTTGMTLAKNFLLGGKATTVALTAGERGAPPGSDDAAIEAFRLKNIASAEEFASAMGGKFIDVGYPDGEAPDNKELRLKLCDIIREEKPDVILTHWGNSMHVDHITANRAVNDAIYFASLRGLDRKFPPHSCTGPYYAENWEDAHGFVPYVYVDVSDSYELWEGAVKKLWLTLNSPWFKYLEYYDALSRSRGALIHKKRAECYMVNPHDMKLVKDCL
ncbi:MAG: PIG-L family deacetylase [Oscillospiraceae bacterium]|nr:PIG-L family deacetylase [Oscillospiraceae bacterium]